MTLLEQLRQDTRPQHEQIEDLLYSHSLRNATLTEAEYLHLLRTHWAFHSSLETAIDQHPVFFADYNAEMRRKTPWLKADLARQGITPEPLPNAFSGWQRLELLGATYVGEGSMLGGKVVMHHLQKSPALHSVLEQARFYRGYGASALDNWKAFGQFLTAQAGENGETVIEAARRAFKLYATLFQHYAPANRPALT